MIFIKKNTAAKSYITQNCTVKNIIHITLAEQIARIRKRNGERKAGEFVKKWIPLEEKYINAFNIKKRADFVIGTPSGKQPL